MSQWRHIVACFVQTWMKRHLQQWKHLISNFWTSPNDKMRKKWWIWLYSSFEKYKKFRLTVPSCVDWSVHLFLFRNMCVRHVCVSRSLSVCLCVSVNIQILGRENERSAVLRARAASHNHISKVRLDVRGMGTIGILYFFSLFSEMKYFAASSCAMRCPDLFTTTFN